MKARVEIFADADWADRVAERLSAALAPERRLCLATGNTPTPVYRRVAENFASKGPTVFLLDEFGGLPVDDPGRCEAMLARDLLGPAADWPTVHVPDVDAPDHETAASRFGGLITEGGLDLAVVGLGSNGHIGMNEPGTTVDQPTRVVQLSPATANGARSYGTTITPTWGITVGMAELMDAREVWVLVTGGHKTDILNRVLHGPVDPEAPASFLTEHRNCVFLVDESAAVTGAT